MRSVAYLILTFSLLDLLHTYLVAAGLPGLWRPAVLVFRLPGIFIVCLCRVILFFLFVVFILGA